MIKTRPNFAQNEIVRGNLMRTRWGFLAIAFGGSSVVALELPAPSEEATRKRLEQRCGPIKWVEKAFPGVANLLVRYFEGDPVSFHKIKIDPPNATPFCLEVWKKLRAIPFGGLVTYGELAAMLGRPRAARAVGAAVGANPIPLIIPCHRVVQSGGKLGGFSAPDGIRCKKRMLELEGHRLKSGRIMK